MMNLIRKPTQGLLFAFCLTFSLLAQSDLSQTYIGQDFHLRSDNVPDRMLRHTGSQYYLHPIEDSELFTLDSSFKVVPGLSGQGISLRSHNFPGHYMAHDGFYVNLVAFEDSQDFFDRATWIPRAGLADADALTLEALSHPNHFLRHSGFRAMIYSFQDTDLYRRDATWHPEPVWPQFLIIAGAPYDYNSSGHYEKLGTYGNEPLYRHESQGTVHSLYRRADGRWYLDFNEPGEDWSGTIAHSWQAQETPWYGSWRSASMVLPLWPQLNNLSHNLLKNASGEAGDLSHWTITEGASVPQPIVVDHPQNPGFRFSYDTVKKTQVISLLGEGFTEAQLDQTRPIHIYQRVAKTWCDQDNYSLRVELLDRDKNVLHTFAQAGKVAREEGQKRCEDFSDFLDINHIIRNYPQGVRYIRWTDGGSDSEYWQGYYGPTLKDASLKIETELVYHPWLNQDPANGDCAFIDTEGRWVQAHCPNNVKRFACFDGSINAWRITSAAGVWLSGQQQCQTEFGDQAVFAVPKTEESNAKLRQRVSEDTWLNLTDQTVEGVWQSWRTDEFDNLLDNGSAEWGSLQGWQYDQRAHWSVVDFHGESIFAAKPYPKPAPHHTERTQLIDLVAKGFNAAKMDAVPALTATQGYRIGPHANPNACVTIDFLDQNQNLLHSVTECLDDDFSINDEPVNRFIQIHATDYPTGTRYLRWTDTIENAAVLLLDNARLHLDPSQPAARRARALKKEDCTYEVPVHKVEVRVSVGNNGTDDTVHLNIFGKQTSLSEWFHDDFEANTSYTYSVEFKKPQILTPDREISGLLRLAQSDWDCDTFELTGFEVLINDRSAFKQAGMHLLIRTVTFLNPFGGGNSDYYFSFKLPEEFFNPAQRCDAWDHDLYDAVHLAEQKHFSIDRTKADAWISSMYEDTDFIDVDKNNNILAPRVAMLDFVAPSDTLSLARQISAITKPNANATDLDTTIVLSMAGSTAQNRVQRFPGDLDFLARVVIEAESAAEARRGLAAIVADLVTRQPQHADLDYDFIEVKYGKTSTGAPITWSREEVIDGEKTIDGQTYRFNDASDHLFIKADWIFARHHDGLLLNTSVMFDPIWKKPDGSYQTLDASLDVFVQEIYLSAADQAKQTITSLFNALPASLMDTYKTGMRGEIIKHAKKNNYGKVAKRLYNLLKVERDFVSAVYVGEIFDEPTLKLYELWSRLKGVEEALTNSALDHGDCRAMMDLMIREANQSDLPNKPTYLNDLNRIRNGINTNMDNAAWSSDVRAVQTKMLNEVNQWIKPILEANPAVRAYLP